MAGPFFEGRAWLVELLLALPTSLGLLSIITSQLSSLRGRVLWVLLSFGEKGGRCLNQMLILLHGCCYAWGVSCLMPHST